MNWAHEVDIWMAGCLFFDLLTDNTLFEDLPETEKWSESWHVAQMVGLLGEPPADFLVEGAHSELYFDNSGS